MENKTKYNYMCHLVGFSWTTCRYYESNKNGQRADNASAGICKRLWKHITKPYTNIKPRKHNILRPSKL